MNQASSQANLRVSVFICGLFLLHVCSIKAMSQAQVAATQPPDWRITEKEVVAVQVGLIRRGYLKGRPSGTFDRKTREAVSNYQTDNGLKVTGRIDYATYNHLALVYPATGREAEVLLQGGNPSKVTESVKKTTAGAGRAVSSAGKTVGRGARAGMERTRDMGVYVASKSKAAAQGVGNMTVRGVKGAGRSTMRASNALFSRSDTDLEDEISRVIQSNPTTRGWRFKVKAGGVTLLVPREHNADIGEVVSNIRKVAGVKSIFVIAQ